MTRAARRARRAPATHKRPFDASEMVASLARARAPGLFAQRPSRRPGRGRPRAARDGAPAIDRRRGGAARALSMASTGARRCSSSTAASRSLRQRRAPAPRARAAAERRDERAARRRSGRPHATTRARATEERRRARCRSLYPPITHGRVLEHGRARPRPRRRAGARSAATARRRSIQQSSLACSDRAKTAGDDEDRLGGRLSRSSTNSRGTHDRVARRDEAPSRGAIPLCQLRDESRDQHVASSA